MRQDYRLMAAVESCTLCPLSKAHSDGEHAVAALPGARYEPGGLALMVDAATEHATRTGEPMSPGLIRGKWPNEGMELDTMLADVGITRDDVLLMNRVRCMPPGMRTADYPSAILNCEVWTTAEFEAYDPGLVVLMGTVAVHYVFSATAKVGVTRGKFLPIKGEARTRVYTATYAPAAARRDAATRDKCVADLRSAYDLWYLLDKGV